MKRDYGPCDLLRSRVIRLEAENEVRTVLFVPNDWARRDREVPKYQQSGYRSAYQSGYEVGWRGQQPGEPYSQGWMQKAYLAGYDQGHKDSELAILRVVERPLK